jgi:hypothetical protein
MAFLHPGTTGRADLHLEPLAVTPRQACLLLRIGNTHLYELLGAGSLTVTKMVGRVGSRWTASAAA